MSRMFFILAANVEGLAQLGNCCSVRPALGDIKETKFLRYCKVASGTGSVAKTRWRNSKRSSQKLVLSYLYMLMLACPAPNCAKLFVRRWLALPKFLNLELSHLALNYYDTNKVYWDLMYLLVIGNIQYLEVGNQAFCSNIDIHLFLLLDL